MTQKYFGLRGKHTITTNDTATQAQLLAAGFEEYPAVTGNPTLRFVDGEWRDVRATRHYGRAGRFEQSALLNEDEHDAIRAQGFEEYAARPPEKFQQLYATVNGGKTWEIDLPAYKQMLIAATKTDALQRARQSFAPAAVEAIYRQTEADITAATDQASVDAVMAGIVYPE